MMMMDHCVHGVSYPHCAYCHQFLWPAAQPTNALSGPVMGCICPPGANKECENPICPRKGYQTAKVG